MLVRLLRMMMVVHVVDGGAGWRQRRRKRRRLLLRLLLLRLQRHLLRLQRMRRIDAGAAVHLTRGHNVRMDGRVVVAGADGRNGDWSRSVRRPDGLVADGRHRNGHRLLVVVMVMRMVVRMMRMMVHVND